MRRITNLTASTVFSIVTLFATGVGSAYSGEKQFFSGIAGSWYGPGEIVAGKYKGTKFTCRLNGKSVQKNVGMDIAGSCRIGMFSQPMSARIKKSGNSYSGKFLDGEKGEGMDVTGGRFTTSRLVVGLKRKKLDATMVARLDKNRKLNVTISVDVQGKMIPVIGMALDKTAHTSLLK
jgi:hypothetical protein